jgi:adenylate cyclase class 2
VLRLRRAEGRAVVTYKGPATIAQDVKSREELEVVVSDAEVFEQILAGLGLRPSFRYQKYRESYGHGDAEIVIDETPIGTFLEIEGAADAIHGVAAALGFSRDDYVLESYVALFLASGGAGDMLFEPQK